MTKELFLPENPGPLSTLTLLWTLSDDPQLAGCHYKVSQHLLISVLHLHWMLAIFCTDHTPNSQDLLSLLLVTWHRKSEGTRQQPQLNLMHPTGKCSLLWSAGRPVLWTEVDLHPHLPCKAVFLSLWMWGFWSNGYAAERPTRAAGHSLGSEGCDSFPHHS